MRVYHWLKNQMGCSVQTAGTICLLGNIVIWFLVGSLLGWAYCAMSGSRDYENIIGGLGAFMALFPGAVAEMFRLLDEG